MNIVEMKFCERYEAKVLELKFLTVLKDDLTEKGRKTLAEIERWIDFNADKYLVITGKK